MSKFPTLSAYLKADPSELRSMQERFTHACYHELQSASGFPDLSAGTHRLTTALAHAGFKSTVLDEDGESLIASGVVLGDGRSILIEACWDDDEGASVLCAFRNGAAYLVLAESRTEGLVEVENGK